MGKAKAKPADKPKVGRGKKADGAAPKPAAVERVRLADLVVDLSVQPREQGLDQQHADDMADWLRGHPGDDLPAAVVYRDPSTGANVLSEGFHRSEAYSRAGRDYLPCEVRAGDLAAAKLNAAASNQGHGLKRSPEDKRRAVRVVLSLRPEWSDRLVAEHAGVAIGTVSDERSRLPGAQNAHLDRVGKDGKTYQTPRARTRKAGEVPPAAPEPAEPGRATGPDAGPWRDKPVADLDLPAVISGKLHLASVGTCGQLYDRMEAGETFDLTPARLADLGDRLMALAEPASPPPPAAGPAPAEEPPGPVVAVYDEKGRPVPEHLRPVFAERTWYRSFGLKVTALVADAEKQAARPGGDALTMNAVRVDGDNFAAAVKGAMPYVVCPTCDGAGVLGSKACCPDCPAVPAAERGRGWLSTGRYHQLPAAKRKKCDGPWSRDQAA